MRWYVPCSLPPWVNNRIVNPWWARRYAARGYTLAVEHYTLSADPVIVPASQHTINDRWSRTAIFVLGQNKRSELVSEIAIRCNALLKDRW